MIKELDKEISKIRNQMEKEAQDQNEKLAKQQEELALLRERKEKIRCNLIKAIKKNFEGIIPNITVDEYGVKIRLIDEAKNETYVLDHIYNDTSFDFIDRKTAYKIVDLYNQVYDMPVEKEIGSGDFTGYSNSLLAPFYHKLPNSNN
jgi:hypothetical protein